MPSMTRQFATGTTSTEGRAAPHRVERRPSRMSVLVVAGALVASLVTVALVVLSSPTGLGSHAITWREQGRLGTSIPVSLVPSASATIGASERGFWPRRQGSSFRTQAGGIHGIFTSSGAELRNRQGTVEFSFAGVGRGNRLNPETAVAPIVASNEVRYRFEAVTEYYSNGPLGVEQGFVVDQRPQSGKGALVLAVRVGGSLTPVKTGSQVAFRTPRGATVMRYGDLTVIDASGRLLPAQMQVQGRTLELRVDDRKAHYPLRIDPFIQETQLGCTETCGVGAVALSADGSTALLTGVQSSEPDTHPFAWVFTRSGSTWTQQAVIKGNSEDSGSCFCLSAALSADGNTALLGGPEYNKPVGGTSLEGGAVVFARSAGVWSQQGGPLTGTGATGPRSFGISVALSGDGTTALIGAYQDNFGSGSTGSAFVFKRTGEAWTEQGPKLVGQRQDEEGEFGKSVALSYDGSTALVGMPGTSTSTTVPVGAGYVFTRSGETWTQPGIKLTSSEAIKANLGTSVALSSDGNTALLGGPGYSKSHGAAWVVTRTGETWSQQGARLMGGGQQGAARFGNDVSLSSDGNVAIIGGPFDNKETGAVWELFRWHNVWTQQGEKLAGARVKERFGKSLGLSADETAALIGTSSTAEVFGEPPIGPPMASLNPTTGPAGGGTAVTIVGTDLAEATDVKFGATGAASFTVNSATSITATTPPEAAGVVDVTVTTPEGVSALSSNDRFKFLPTISGVSPKTGPTAGGTPVTISGEGFAPGSLTVFKFGSAQAPSVNCISTTQCSVLSPAHGAGTVDVKATVDKLTSSKTRPSDQFTYE